MDTIIIKIYDPKKFQFKKKHLFCPEIESRKYHQLSETEKQTKRYYLRKFTLKAPLQENYVPVIDVLETLDKEKTDYIYSDYTVFTTKIIVWKQFARNIR